MKDFKIISINGVEYTNPKTLIDDLYVNNDDFSNENIDYLRNYIWETIDETNGNIPWYIFYLMEEIDFPFAEAIDNETIDYDLYKGWRTGKIIFQSPITKNYYATYYTEGRGGEMDFEGVLFRVEPYDKIVKSWREIDDVIDDKDIDLKIIKDYLKQAVKDLNRSSDGIDFCEHSCYNCLHDINDDCTYGCRYKWKYTDIVEGMLGEKIE